MIACIQIALMAITKMEMKAAMKEARQQRKTKQQNGNNWLPYTAEDQWQGHVRCAHWL